MYLFKIITTLAAVIFTTSLGSPVAPVSPTATSAATASTGLPPAPSGPVPDFSTPMNDPNPPPLISNTNEADCGDSTFVNQISGASPTVDDCLVIAKNIGKGGEWSVEASIAAQHQLVQYGTCAFGVQADYTTGSRFYVGNQDIIDIIHSSIQFFASNERVQTKGDMSCEGAGGKSPKVNWGLYHNKGLVRHDSLATSTDFVRRDLLSLQHRASFGSRALPNETNPATPFTPSSAVNQCGPSTFTNEHNNKSPLIADCLRIATDIAQSGYWQVKATGSMDTFARVVQAGTCFFGMAATIFVPGQDDYFYVGSEDITDLINDSVQKFGSQGKVGAQGEIQCASYTDNGALTHVKWAIYNVEALQFESNTTSSNDTVLTKSLLAPKSLTSNLLPARAADVPGRECDYPSSKVSFHNLTTDYSPLTQDCLNIADALDENASWALDMTSKTPTPGGYHTFRTNGTCAWGYNVEPAFYELGLSTLNLGGSDVMAVIDISTWFAGSRGRLEVKGGMMCRGSGERETDMPVKVNWAVYHT